MKVVSILELQAKRALPMFVVAEGSKAYELALTAAISTVQASLSMFLEREMVSLDDQGTVQSAVRNELGEAVLRGLALSESHWLNAALEADRLAEAKTGDCAKKPATYESALAAQSARKWEKARFGAARTAQIAMHWLSVREPEEAAA